MDVAVLVVGDASFNGECHLVDHCQLVVKLVEAARGGFVSACGGRPCGRR